MSGVVLRCPTCGTTQGHAGECDACFEGEVRHFCSNHTPGVWLDEPVCNQCGAKFGEAPRRAAPPPPSGARTGPPRETRRPEPRSPIPRDPEPEPSFTRPRRPPPRVADPVVTPRRPSLADLLATMSTERRERASKRVTLPRGDATPVATRKPIPVMGCFVRFVLFALLLLALAVAGLFLLMGGGLETFVVDLGQSTGLMAGTPEQTTRGIDAFKRGDLATAEQELSQAAMSYPRSALALLYLAKMRTDAGDLSKAREYLETAVAREPNSVVAHRQLGLTYLATARASGRLSTGRLRSHDDLLLADRHFAIAATLDPGDRAALGYRACTLGELGAEAEAAQLLSAAGDGPWQSCIRTGTEGR